VTELSDCPGRSGRGQVGLLTRALRCRFPKGIPKPDTDPGALNLREMTMQGPLFGVIVLLLFSGCASYGVVQNAPLPGTAGEQSYSIRTFMEDWRTDENALMLAFSGGGTRAAALSYGVLKELRDTSIVSDGRTKRLLDEVHSISSVSGGSFTAGYYGVYGEKIFTDYKEAFLNRDVEGGLKSKLFNPFRWFGSTGRTEWAVEYYQEHVFHDATFADMLQPGRPLIVINASDLGCGARFSFVQEYFNLLCSDLSTFPVARAVAASSAVPVVFNPVVVENYASCQLGTADSIWTAKQRSADDARMTLVLDELESYSDKDKRKYAHFVDGGITDNLGLRAVYEIVEVSSGGMGPFTKKYGRHPPRRIVMISVDASARAERVMDMSIKQPGLMETVGAMSDIQLHLYNVATIELMEETLTRWTKELSTPERPVEAYFIYLSFKDIKDPKRSAFFNEVPTSFDLTGEQVEGLIEVGGELLRVNPEFRRLMADLHGSRLSQKP
jgi:NTE family protein